jgi:hypothetical protein
MRRLHARASASSRPAIARYKDCTSSAPLPAESGAIRAARAILA